MALSSGTRLGPYEITGPLGIGGMGEVYRARDTRLDRTVAVKVLGNGLAQAPGFRDRFEQEARTVSSLNHPNICALYDVGNQDGTEFLVMEYLDGETLATHLQRGPMGLQECLKYAIELANALDNGSSPRNRSPRSEAGQHHALQIRREADGFWSRGQPERGLIKGEGSLPD